MVEVGGQGGRTGRRAALLVAHSDFQILRPPCKLVTVGFYSIEIAKKVFVTFKTFSMST